MMRPPDSAAPPPPALRRAFGVSLGFSLASALLPAPAFSQPQPAPPQAAADAGAAPASPPAAARSLDELAAGGLDTAVLAGVPTPAERTAVLSGARRAMDAARAIRGPAEAAAGAALLAGRAAALLAGASAGEDRAAARADAMAALRGAESAVTAAEALRRTTLAAALLLGAPPSADEQAEADDLLAGVLDLPAGPDPLMQAPPAVLREAWLVQVAGATSPEEARRRAQAAAERIPALAGSRALAEAETAAALRRLHRAQAAWDESALTPLARHLEAGPAPDPASRRLLAAKILAAGEPAPSAATPGAARAWALGWAALDRGEPAAASALLARAAAALPPAAGAAVLEDAAGALAPHSPAHAAALLLDLSRRPTAPRERRGGAAAEAARLLLALSDPNLDATLDAALALVSEHTPSRQGPLAAAALVARADRTRGAPTLADARWAAATARWLTSPGPPASAGARAAAALIEPVADALAAAPNAPPAEAVSRLTLLETDVAAAASRDGPLLPTLRRVRYRLAQVRARLGEKPAIAELAAMLAAGAAAGLPGGDAELRLALAAGQAAVGDHAAAVGTLTPLVDAIDAGDAGITPRTRPGAYWLAWAGILESLHAGADAERRAQIRLRVRRLRVIDPAFGGGPAAARIDAIAAAVGG